MPLAFSIMLRLSETREGSARAVAGLGFGFTQWRWRGLLGVPLIARQTLVAFMDLHPEARPSLIHWFLTTKAADWPSMNDVMATFPKAIVLNGERVRFEVA